jgi:hypothetical protein
MYDFLDMSNGCYYNFNVIRYTWNKKNFNDELWVLLVPPPWSSFLDKPIEWHKNQRKDIATEMTEAWFWVLCMIPPGKSNYFENWKTGAFSFQNYAHAIWSVLFRDSLSKLSKPRDIITSSLWLPAIIAALNTVNDQEKENRQIVVWAPLDSLQHVLSVQLRHFPWMTKEKLMKAYADQNWLNLKSDIIEAELNNPFIIEAELNNPFIIEAELNNQFILNVWFQDLFNAWYRQVSIYGNEQDQYFTYKNDIRFNFKNVHYFSEANRKDPFWHEFTQENAEKARLLIKKFLSNT